MYRCVQKYVNECRKKGADYCVILSHLGDGELMGDFSSVELARNTSGVDVILDGHAHSVLPYSVEKNKPPKKTNCLIFIGGFNTLFYKRWDTLPP